MTGRICWSFVLVLVASCCLTLSAKEAPWRKLESEHFEIFTQDSPRNARKVLVHLEQVRAVYASLTNNPIARPGKGRVVLFRNKAEYQAYSGMGVSDAYYTTSRNLDYIVLYDFNANSERVLNHEYFHLFSAHADFGLPLWLEEGLADYFSTLKIGAKDVSVGLPVVEHIRYLNQLTGRLIPLNRIIAIDRSARREADYGSVVQLYAQAWALTHMTFLGKDLMPRSQEFFQAIRDGKSAEDAYQEIYGIEMKDLERLLSQYVQRRSYSFYKHTVAGLNAKAPVEDVAIEEWEAPLLLANLLLNVRRTDEANAALADLEERFPVIPEIAEAQGYSAMGELDRETAAKHFRRAAANGSTNANLYYDLVLSACQYNSYDPECQKWANDALRFDPKHQEIRRWVIGYVLNAGKYDHALAYLMRAGTVKAVDAPEHFMQIAYASSGLGRFEEARKAIERGLEHATKPEEIARLGRVQSMVESMVESMASAAEERQRYANLASQQQIQQRVAEGSLMLFEPPSEDSRPQLFPKFDGDGRPHMARGMPRGQEPFEEDEDFVVELVSYFADQEGNETAGGFLKEVRCGDTPLFVVQADGNELVLVADDPAAIEVFRDGDRVTDHHFTCGAQTATKVQVGYQTGDAPEGTAGRLRLLHFE
jgi:Flp pilus assembly protein TadD